MARVNRSLAANVSFAALLICLVPQAATAQAPQPSPRIVLPPLPDVDVKVGKPDESAIPAAIAEKSEAPAVAPPQAVVEAPAPAPVAAAPANPAPVTAPAQPARPPAMVAGPAEPSRPTAATAPPIMAPVAPKSVETAQPVVPAATSLETALRSELEAAARDAPRKKLLAFYAARNFAALWVTDSGWKPGARGALARLEKAGDDGLDIKAAPAPASAGSDDKSRALAEIALSQAVIAYGQQASGARINPRSVSSLITEKPEVAEADKILAAVSGTVDADAALAAFNPPHAGYRGLRAKLAEIRRNRPPEPVRVAMGPTLRIGMKDARVPSLRVRLKLEADPAPADDDILYDARIASAVAAFQRSKALPASGQLNPATVAALGGGAGNIENEILANMERWRWLPRSSSGDRIEVNIPDFTVRVTRGGELVHTARVIVGKPDTPTPVFSNRMQFLEVNPYWNVPESIIKNEMMPRQAQDPTYLQRMGYQVSTDRKGRMVVRQPPGNRNALGFIKFMFPNEHAVYLHDTPSRTLFANPRRAYSHGCVRVDQPFRLAEIVLGKDNGWSEERVKRLIGTGNKTIHLPKTIDVHIEYFTTFVDDAGNLQTRDDIYGYSRRLKAAMGLVG